MSRARKRETAARRGERLRRRLRAAERRRVAGMIRRRRARALVAMALRSGHFRQVVRAHVPKSWARRLRTGKAL